MNEKHINLATESTTNEEKKSLSRDLLSRLEQKFSLTPDLNNNTQKSRTVL